MGQAVSKVVKRLARQCGKWGGELRLMSREEFQALNLRWGSGARTVHPLGGHGIDIRKAEIYAIHEDANAGVLIHEMGHVFLAGMKSEPDWLGWEIAMARKFRCMRVWSEQNADYCLDVDGYDRDWNELDVGEIRRVCAERIAYAQNIGIVSPDGEPMCTRGAP